MRSKLADFDDQMHRTESASVTFQKGLYHLFMLKNRPSIDVFGQILRIYQCLFQICVTQLLLDSDFSLNRRVPPRLKRLCKDPDHPTREELDPAAIVTHTMLERTWKGFRQGHPLLSSSEHSLDLYRRVVESRHNLLYRPFLLADRFWEDCTLIDLLQDAPEVDEIEQAYRLFLQGIADWHIVFMKELRDQNSSSKRYAGYFLEQTFTVYRDRRDNRPTETLLLTYARMLNPGDEQTLQELKEYRNKLLDVVNLMKAPHISFLDSWKVGEL